VINDEGGGERGVGGGGGGGGNANYDQNEVNGFEYALGELSIRNADGSAPNAD